jgi:hypothetical protein
MWREIEALPWKDDQCGNNPDSAFALSSAGWRRQTAKPCYSSATDVAALYLLLSSKDGGAPKTKWRSKK